MENAKYVYYKAGTKIYEVPKYKPGRPKNDGSRELDKMMYAIDVSIVETDAVATLKKETGCFVLLCADRSPGFGFASIVIGLEIN